MNKREVGTFYEKIAEKFLVDKGVKILDRNYRCRIGEVDLIGIEGDYIVFFEVKYRKNSNYGSPLSAVDYRKQRKIIAVACYYLSYKHTDRYVRFDVIGICDKEIEWIKNAFCIS